MQYSAVIFDLDGTLLDTIADIARAMNRVLKAHGLPQHPSEAYYGMVGWGLEETMRRALPRNCREPELIRRCYADAVEAYQEAPVLETRPYNGIPELLRALRQHGVRCAVLSNKHEDLVRVIVDAALGCELFNAVRGARDGVPKKPDPQSALETAAELGCEPREMLLVGDSEIDIATARAAGMTAAAVSWGFSRAAELTEARPDVILQSPDDLLSVVGVERPDTTVATTHSATEEPR